LWPRDAPMTDHVVILGYGPIGRATASRLAKTGSPVTVAQRTAPQDLPTGVGFVRCDVLDAASLSGAVAGATQVVAAFGFPYDRTVWADAWPRAMANLLAACETARARLVFFDNLYMYGPQRAPLTEDMPLTGDGEKPRVRAEITRLWLAARDAGRVKVAALRAPDFYGPYAGNSHLGDKAFGALAKGKPAMVLALPDTPHDFAYVPDLARMVETLLVAPDEDFGQVWHSPCAPTRTPREILALGATALGMKLRLHSVPLTLFPILGLAVPFLRESYEMRFTFDRPYQVDATKWRQRFWSDVTPFEIGARETARAFLAQFRLVANCDVSEREVL
jgi:nucleoside-diphosphate-sugar epimerase